MQKIVLEKWRTESLRTDGPTGRAAVPPIGAQLATALAKQNSGAALNFAELCQIARHYHAKQDMAGYARLLLNFDPRLRGHIGNCQNSEFLQATGCVPGAVNIYRKLRYKTLSGEKTCFEKIYTRKSPDFQRMQWFYRNMAAELTVAAPRLLEIVEGRQLAVCIFEFQPFKHSSADGLFAIVNAMSRFAARHPQSAYPDAPDCMKRWPALCDTRYSNLRENLLLAGYTKNEIAQLRHRIDGFATVFNHGDLHRFNVGANDTVYDWDSCCFAPPGHEIGRSIAALRSFERLGGLQSAITNRFSDYLSEWPDVRLQILIFFLIYDAKTRLSPDDTARIAFLREVFDRVAATPSR